MYIKAQYFLWGKRASNLHSVHILLQNLEIHIAVHWAWSDGQFLRFAFLCMNLQKNKNVF